MVAADSLASSLIKTFYSSMHFSMPIDANPLDEMQGVTRGPFAMRRVIGSPLHDGSKVRMEN